MIPIDPQTLRVQQHFVRHQPALKAFVLALAPGFADAEDVLQEAFLTITAKAAKYEEGTSFFAWACAIVRFKLLEHQRRGRRTTGLSAEVLAALEASAPPVTFFEGRLALLEDCLDRLPERAREIVRLRYHGEHGAAEIARLLSWTPNSVSVALSRAREALRICMRGHLGEVAA